MSLRSEQASAGPDLTDGQLMLRVSAGSRHAFGMLYQRYNGRVHAYLWRMLRDEALVDDLAQESFIKLWQARHAWVESGSVAGFLVRVARNLALNSEKKRQVRQRYAVIGAAHEPVSASVDDVLDQNDLIARVDAAIAALPARQGQIFSLKRDAGLSYKEIGSLLGISPKTVEVHLGNAYRSLREALLDVHQERR